VFDLARGTRSRLTFGGATHLMPAWSPDGQRVVYVRQNGTTMMTGTSLCVREANGGGQEEVLMAGEAIATLLSPQLSPDEKYLLHTEQQGPSAGIWALPLEKGKASGKPIPIVMPQNAQSRVSQFRLSPDGRWLAYSSNESGREEIYVTRFPSGPGRWQISQAGATFPAWRADGREIFFAGTDGQIYSASVNPKGEEFELEKVVALFSYGFIGPVGTPLDPTPDGQKFIFETLPEGAPTPLVFVSNWTGDLKK